MSKSVTNRLFSMVISYWPLLIVSTISAFIYVAFNGISVWLTASLFNNILTDFEDLIINHNTLRNAKYTLNDQLKYWTNELKIQLENILVISDDLSLPFGKIRLKKKGSDGGHNGLKSINNALNSSNYSRLRFGIDDNFRPGYQSEYVLDPFSVDEQKDLTNNIEISSEIALNFCHIGIDRTMNKYN